MHFKLLAKPHDLRISFLKHIRNGNFLAAFEMKKTLPDAAWVTLLGSKTTTSQKDCVDLFIDFLASKTDEELKTYLEDLKKQDEVPLLCTFFKDAYQHNLFISQNVVVLKLKRIISILTSKRITDASLFKLLTSGIFPGLKIGSPDDNATTTRCLRHARIFQHLSECSDTPSSPKILSIGPGYIPKGTLIDENLLAPHDFSPEIHELRTFFPFLTHLDIVDQSKEVLDAALTSYTELPLYPHQPLAPLDRIKAHQNRLIPSSTSFMPLPYAKDRYDLIFALYSLMHVFKTSEALYAHRLSVITALCHWLANQGRLIIDVESIGYTPSHSAASIAAELQKELDVPDRNFVLTVTVLKTPTYSYLLFKKDRSPSRR